MEALRFVVDGRNATCVIDSFCSTRGGHVSYWASHWSNVWRGRLSYDARIALLVGACLKVL